MKASIFAVVVSLVTPILLTSCSTDPQPSKSEIEQALAAQLPAFARVSRLSVEATENMGTKVEPVWHSRLRATVTVTSPTFTPDGTDGRVVFLRVIKRDGETTELFWKSVSTLYEGKWRIIFEGRPIESGLPESAFGQNVIIRGSKAETAYLAEQAQQERLAIFLPERHSEAAQNEAEAQRMAQKLEKAREDEVIDALHTQDTLPGAIDAPPGPPTSQASGSGGGTGTASGIGPGTGSQLGPGSGGETGGGVYRPGNGVNMPRVLREVRPRMTSDAMRAKIQGTVLLECVVQKDGTVGDVQVIRSLDATFGLDQEAIKAAKQWRFAPGTRLGEPVQVLITIELTFTLR